MSTDSDSSSRGGGPAGGSFREITRDRLLNEMLRSTRQNKGSTWKVLIMDKLTVKIMSSSCKMGDITDQGVSLVEDLYKRRQPLPSMDAIYFMQPTKQNIDIFMSNMSGKRPLYKKAYIFFSSPIQKEWVAHIRKDSSVLARVGALSEMNLEYFAIDSQGFVTDHDKALEELFTENAEGSMNYNSCINTMATRIATVFASMKTETCELLIVDRSIDQIAPVIHEWTYDAMCHDLLSMDGNKYVQEVPNTSGSGTEKKEVLLEDHDPIWFELRDVHVADANLRLHEKMRDFISKNKAAQLHQARTNGELSTKELQKMVQALPQYTDQIDKLSLHVEIAEKLFDIIKEEHLKDVGQLEQDLVFGDAGSKEVIDFFRTHQDISRENKLRLLMIYAAINPEKIQSEKGAKLMQLAGLSADDMIAVNNMRCICAHETKKSSKGGFPLKFEIRKKKRGIRKERIGEESTWTLSRFYPILEDLIEKLSKGELPKDEYHCMSDPSSSFRGISSSMSARTSPAHQPAQSMRSRRTGGTWARPRNSDDGYSSDSVLKHASSDMRKLGRRLFIFVVGGATRSELRAVHKLSSKLKREIILGSSSLDDPPKFITKLKMMSNEELSLDDLQI
ncbi:hypothetical protein CFC21_027593 [Triticum aestivum]|uniref:SNARE-interacting protein KEULE n=2 Tax=Triticum aestivum TaxID=4565 RepID=A0A3B6D635_WHEAT|nr:hypothetical protein CFC21_027593 [Triticum aestivum]